MAGALGPAVDDGHGRLAAQSEARPPVDLDAAAELSPPRLEGLPLLFGFGSFQKCSHQRRMG